MDIETDLTVYRKAQQHEEEECGEQLRHWHRYKGLWINDEHQTRTFNTNRRGNLQKYEFMFKNYKYNWRSYLQRTRQLLVHYFMIDVDHTNHDAQT